MEYDNNIKSFKDIAKSFEYFPRIFGLLLNIDKTHLIIIVILNIFNGFIPTLSIIATQYLINVLQTNIKYNFNYILVPFLIYIGVNLLSAITLQLINYFQSLFQLRISYKLNVMILEKTETLNLKDYEDSDIYNKLKRAQDQAGSRPYTVFTLFLNLISSVITLASSSTILIFWKSWILLIIMIVPIISSLYMINLGYLQYKIEWMRVEKGRKSWYLSYLLTNDIAFKEIKLYNLANFFINEYQKLNKEFLSQDTKIIIKRTRISILFEMVDEIVGGCICLLIIRAAFLGQILLGSTIAYIRCISNVQAKTQDILSTISSMYQNNLFIKQFFEFIDLTSKDNNITKTDNKVKIQDIRSIEFKNVYFKYNESKDYVLKNISFKINKGETIALVGINGSGKTTLVKLLAGFYDDYEGEILINNIPMNKIDKISMREKIGMLFQDFTKYELTCRENVGVGKLNFINDNDKLLNAITKADGISILKRLSNGIDTQLGVWFDNGTQLSGGQWQKIALSRAFLRNADCYILDEPSSSLDPIAEHEVFAKSFQLVKIKIGIFITHRLSNIEDIATRIFVLNNGELVEEGDHNSLMELKGYYMKMYNMQNIPIKDSNIA